jgi:two-component system sensor histidine kinase KdpD
LQGSLVDELVRGSGPIDVLVTRGDEAAGARERPMLSTRPAQRPHEWWLAAAAIGVATAINLGLHSYITLADITMIYLLAVVLVASRVTRAPALFASVLAVAALDFAFVEPRWTFAVRDLRHILTFAIMLVVGVIVSTLTVRIRAQASAARQRERRTASLLALSRELAVRQAARDIASAGAQQVEALLGIPTAVLLADANGEALESYAGAGTPQAANERELAVARWVLEHRRPAGRGTETLPAARFTFLPLIGSSRTVGVFGVDSGDRSEPLAPSEQQLLETIVTQVASSLERALLAAEAERSRVAAETESMRSALLAAVSHDLRTPLATLRGATEVLQDGTALDERARQELLETVHDEVQRLERLVVDLLELSRLESHQAAVRREWYPAEDWIRAAIGRSARQLKGRDVRLELPDQVIGASVDATLLEQVMINLLDNAAKYTPADSPIDVALRRFGGSLEVTVADRGPGIPPGEELRIFEKFHRAGSDRNVRGTGLGLAVCRAIVTAHGGLITAEPREGGGAVLRFTLPAEDAPPADTA